MPTDLPIACSLTAGELPERLRQMADLGRDALLDTRIENERAQLPLPQAPACARAST
jgi:hypothetical protein